MKETKEILKDYVSDILAVEKDILGMVERQTRDNRVRRYQEAYELLMKLQATLNGHTIALEQMLSTTNGGAGGPESTLKKAAATAVGVVTGFYERLRQEDTVSRNLRDDYTTLSLAVISYTMLHTTALALEDATISDVALVHLNDLTPYVAALSRIVPTVVAMELSHEGKVISPAAGEEAVHATQRAWSREVIG